MTKLLLALAFCISLVALPWWASALSAIVFLAEGGSPFLIIAGGFILDELSGAPIAAMGGFAFLYTCFFALLAGVAVYLRSTVFE